MKHQARQHERAARRVNSNDAVAAATASAAWTTQRRAYHDLLRRKREELWQSKIGAERSCSQQLWQSVEAFMGRGQAPASDAITP